MAPGERRTILSEKYPGTMAEKTAVPSANVFAKPASLTTAEAAALGTSWLTAYSLLFDAAGIKPGDSVLIQGAGGGVSTAAIQLAHAAGLEVFVTSRDADKRAKALKLGANAALETGARLPRKVDAVIESVGAATWGHSVRSVRPGGTIAICGATTGDQPGAELTRLFFQDIRVQGCTMGSREDFARLLRFVEHADLHPVIDSVVSGLDAAPEAARRSLMASFIFVSTVLSAELLVCLRAYFRERFSTERGGNRNFFETNAKYFLELVHSLEEFKKWAGKIPAHLSKLILWKFYGLADAFSPNS